MAKDIVDSIGSISDALGTWRQSYLSVIDSELAAGKIDEAEAKKKKKRMLELQKVETALSIFSIAASTAGGIVKIWQAFAAEKLANAETAAATGPAAAVTLGALNAKSLISAIAQTVGLAATGIAQIAAARNGYITAKNNFEAESGGGGASAVSEPALIDSTPYSYTRTLQTADEEQELNRPIYVTVTDINEGLEKNRVRVAESSF